MEESEVINIVGNCKNKKSTGYDGIDMTIIKQVIYHIIKPFTHLCNNSFENGVFPSKMKIAKVVPIAVICVTKSRTGDYDFRACARARRFRASTFSVVRRVCRAITR